MFHYGYLSSITAVLLALAACTSSSGGYGYQGNYSSSSSVWQNYDVRHPVPSTVNVPPRGSQQMYQDNDAAYTQPRRYLCINNLETDFSCE